jgi:nucleoside-diphosphate-sugar epimerase
LKKSKVLITGSTGFVGSAILKFLIKKNFQVYAILKNNKKRKNKSYKNYHLILYKNFPELEKKLKNYKFDILINCATLYSKDDDLKTMLNMIETNISFFLIILKLTIKDVNLIINFGSMMEHLRYKKKYYENFYSITKSTMHNIINLFTNKKEIKFINIKLFETFGEDDQRQKIIPTIIKNYKNNKTIQIRPSNLKLNFINVTSIVKIISDILLKKKFSSGDYCLRSYKFTNIKYLITSINTVLKKKIKIKLFNQKKLTNFKVKSLDLKNIYTKDNIKKFLLNNLIKNIQ